tara:strand:+ start:82 stop:954 length:873 start_codon:yes stop_codon:yes gene_type:complete
MATTTKCMSKMLKKELYEYCKTLIKENQKLQLFNNSQEEEIEKYQSLANNYADETQTNGYGDYIGSVETLEKYIEELTKEIEELKAQVGIHTEKYGGTMVFPSVYNKKKQKCKKLKKEIEELKEENETQKYNCLIKYETDIKQKDISIELIQVKNQKLEKDLEYFQNKCEIMEKELIEEEEKTILFEMVQDLTEESGNKEDTIIKLEKDNKKLQESIVELEAVILSKPNIFYYSYDEEGHIFYDNIEDLVRNTPRIEDCYVYQGNVTEEVIKSNDFLGFSGTEIDYMVKL